MSDKVILLVEDNADDEALTLRALKKNNIHNDVVVARGEICRIGRVKGHGRNSLHRTAAAYPGTPFLRLGIDCVNPDCALRIPSRYQ